MKTLMFPGQGSQQQGMGQALFARHRRLCQQADALLGYSVSELCLQNPEGRLQQTAYTQPAVYFVSCLMYLEHLETPQSRYDCLIGHSLGLFPALFAAEVCDLLTGLEWVAMRGHLMASAVPGAMLAVLGDRLEDLNEHLAELNYSDIDIANYNTSQQYILSGPRERIATLSSLLEAQHYRCIPLKVSGAFHSRYLEPCRRLWVNFLLKQRFNHLQKKIISSTNAEILKADYVLEEISLQFVRPVRWWQSILTLCRQDPEMTFLEIGPGQVLTDLVAQIRRQAQQAEHHTPTIVL